MHPFRSKHPHHRCTPLDSQDRPLRPEPPLAGPSVQTQARLEEPHPPDHLPRRAEDGHQGRAHRADQICSIGHTATDSSTEDEPSSVRRGDTRGNESHRNGQFFETAPGNDAQGRSFTVVAPFVPTEPLAVTLRRTGLPRLQRDFDDLDAPERYHPAALMAMSVCPHRPIPNVKRWRYYTDGSHQADSTTDS